MDNVSPVAAGVQPLREGAAAFCTVGSVVVSVAVGFMSSAAPARPLVRAAQTAPVSSGERGRERGTGRGRGRRRASDRTDSDRRDSGRLGVA